MIDELSKIRYARFRLEMVAVDRLKLPSYKGSTLRGAFGHAFKKLVCVKQDMDCATCLICAQCVYYYVFETPFSGREDSRGYDFAPHPFVIEPPGETRQIYEAGDELPVGLVLVGRALDSLPYFIYAFEEMGRRGLGVGRGKVALKRVFALSAAGEQCIYEADTGMLDLDYPVFAGPSSGEEIGPLVHLRLQTPIRLKTGGRYASSLDFSLLVRALLRRISDLTRFHCSAELELDDDQWIARAEKVQTAAVNTRWYDWERYSLRQEQKMKLGGLVGDVVFTGDIEPFMPLLRLGADLHVGKGTGFGLGRYEIL